MCTVRGLSVREAWCVRPQRGLLSGERRVQNNPCLIGEPGVGKTAVAEGLAQRIVDGDVPAALEGRTLMSLDMGALIAGAKARVFRDFALQRPVCAVGDCVQTCFFAARAHYAVSSSYNMASRGHK